MASVPFSVLFGQTRSQVEPLRLGFAAGIGASAGVYVCAKFVAKLNPILHLLLIASLVLALVFVSFTHHPAPWSAKFMPALFALEVALLPVSYLAVGPVKQTKYGGTDDVPAQWIPDWEDEVLKQVQFGAIRCTVLCCIRITVVCHGTLKRVQWIG